MGNWKTQMEYVVGVDFGSDSVRAVIVRASDGQVAAEAAAAYPRWAQGLYCDPGIRQFRQHPQDYLEALCACVTEACAAAGETVSSRITALSIDTTGSTPCPVNRAGTPLALLPGFEENPNAMFHLWKDHTAGTEAAEITACFSAGTPDYTVYQGPYSSEWYWAKILHTIRQDPAVRAVAYTWVEHCDWMANLLAGRTRPELAYRCACAAGHKAYWHSAWGGLPAKERLAQLDSYLAQVHDTFIQPPEPCTAVVGTITQEWAQRLHLPAQTLICGGSFDAHAGAVGAGVCAGTMVVNIGTSAVNMMVERADALRGTGFAELAGQAETAFSPAMSALRRASRPSATPTPGSNGCCSGHSRVCSPEAACRRSSKTPLRSRQVSSSFRCWNRLRKRCRRSRSSSRSTGSTAADIRTTTIRPAARSADWTSASAHRHSTAHWSRRRPMASGGS